jgi:hypothetical protein
MLQIYDGHGFSYWWVKVSLAGAVRCWLWGCGLSPIVSRKHGFDVDSIGVCWNFLLRSSL